MNREKVNPIKKFLKSLKVDYEQYVGIAIDEPVRLERAHAKKQISLLEEFNIKENDTYKILKPYDLISPTYSFADRGGCWFCPNQKIEELAYLKTHHPELWAELEMFSVAENKVTEGFKYGKTFEQISSEVDKYINSPKQLTLFDYIEEANL